MSSSTSLANELRQRRANNKAVAWFVGSTALNPNNNNNINNNSSNNSSNINNSNNSNSNHQTISWKERLQGKSESKDLLAKLQEMSSAHVNSNRELIQHREQFGGDAGGERTNPSHSLSSNQRNDEVENAEEEVEEESDVIFHPVPGNLG